MRNHNYLMTLHIKKCQKNAYSLLKKNKNLILLIWVQQIHLFLEGSLVFEEDELIHITILE